MGRTFEQSPLAKLLTEKYQYYSNIFTSNNNSDSLTEGLISRAIAMGLHPLEEIIATDHSINLAISGGVFRSLFNEEVPSDIDVYYLGPLDEAKEYLLELKDRFEYWSKNTDSKKYCRYFELERQEKTVSWTKQIAILEFLQSELIPVPIQLIAYQYKTDKDTIIYPKRVNDIISGFDLIPASFGTQVSISSLTDKENEEKKNTFFSRGIITKENTIIHPEFYSCVASKTFKFNLSGILTLKRTSPARFYKYLVDYGYKVKDEETFKLLNHFIGNSEGSIENVDY